MNGVELAAAAGAVGLRDGDMLTVEGATLRFTTIESGGTATAAASQPPLDEGAASPAVGNHQEVVVCCRQQRFVVPLVSSSEPPQEALSAILQRCHRLHGIPFPELVAGEWSVVVRGDGGEAERRSPRRKPPLTPSSLIIPGSELTLSGGGGVGGGDLRPASSSGKEG